MSSSNKRRLKNILKAINKGRFVFKPGKKQWYGMELSITELIWERNLQDGYEIDVYKNNKHIGTIEIDNNLRKSKLEVY